MINAKPVPGCKATFLNRTQEECVDEKADEAQVLFSSTNDEVTSAIKSQRNKSSALLKTVLMKYEKGDISTYLKKVRNGIQLFDSLLF